MKKIVLGLSLFFISLLFVACQQKPSELQEGIWRGALQRADGNNIVFNFEVKDSLNQKIWVIHNAAERLKVDDIHQKGDSLFVEMPFFDSHFNLKINPDHSLSGEWTKIYADRKVTLPFTAAPDNSMRIKAFAKPDTTVEGSWKTHFDREDGGYTSIGLFKQQDGEVTGTFLNPAGDSRYLQGVLSGDTLKLSGFDGGHAVIYIGTVQGQKITGKAYSMNSDPMSFTAERRDYKELPASYAVNNVEKGKVKLDLNLKDMRTGAMVSLADEQYKGKVVILDLLGSWCPNCYDETPFLIDFYKKNKDRGVRIIAVDFERTADFEKSKKAMSSFFNRFDMAYPVVFSGVASGDRERTEKIFPNLPVKINAFPTLIFIDKDGYVRKIHSGFNGPATGKYYDEFKDEFHGIVNSLQAE